MGCLAAQILAHFKDEPGQFYVYRPDAKDCGEEYVYHVRPGAKREEIPEGARWPREFWALILQCGEPDGKELWSGAPEKFAEFLAAEAAKQEA